MTDTPFMYWVGVNTPEGTTPEEERDFNAFYANTHMHEVVDLNPGFLRSMRYELIEPDPRGDFGPPYLAIYEIESQAAADAYIDRIDSESRPAYTPGPPAFAGMQGRWRMFWRRLVPAAGGIGAGAPYINLIGMNIPADTDEAGLAAFDEFYTNIHLPEVVAMSRFLSGARYELYRGYRHPEPGAPRFLAVYEANDDSLRARAERRANPDAGPRLSSGPPTWEAHDTLWRLTYRLIDSYDSRA